MGSFAIVFMEKLLSMLANLRKHLPANAAILSVSMSAILTTFVSFTVIVMITVHERVHTPS